MPTSKPAKPISYAVEQRLRLIDFLFAHYNRVNRSALVDYFGISVPQASADIQLYLKSAGDGVVYDVKNRSYAATLTFKRQYP